MPRRLHEKATKILSRAPRADDLDHIQKIGALHARGIFQEANHTFDRPQAALGAAPRAASAS